MQNPISPNFAFFAKHDDLVARVDDPNSSLIKQRHLAEALARQAAAGLGGGHPQGDFVGAFVPPPSPDYGTRPLVAALDKTR